MQVSVEQAQGLLHRMTVDLPQAMVDEECDKRLRKLAPTLSIKGFRPGKVPFKIAKKRYGESVTQEVLNDLINSSFQQASMEQKLAVANSPVITDIQKKADEGYTYTAEFEVMPVITEVNTDAFKINRPLVEVEEQDVSNTLETLRKQNASWEEAEKESEDGDRLTISFSGTIDGEEFPGGKAEGYPMVLGNKSMLPEFEQGLIGAKAGEERQVEVNFPEDYHGKDVAGKKALFSIQVEKVEIQKLPEPSEEFFAKFGITEGGIEAFREEIKNNLTREMEGIINKEVKDQVIQQLLEKNSIDVPKAQVEEEAKSLLEQNRQQIEQSGGSVPEGMEISMFYSNAESRVRLGYLMGAIANQHDIRVTEEEVDAHLEKMASSYEEPSAFVAYFKESPERLQQIHSLVLEDSIVAWLTEQAETKDIALTVAQLVGTEPRPEQD